MLAHRGVSSTSSLIDAIRLDFSDKDVFGREEETAILRAALERVSEPEGAGEPEVIFLKGASGTGKSVLVKSALRDAARNEMGGFFVVGKFEQFRSLSAALVEAADHLCRQIIHREDRDELVSIIKSG
jgi:predicted ATPase